MGKMFAAAIVFIVIFRVFSAYKIWNISSTDNVTLSGAGDPKRCGLRESVRRRLGRVVLQLMDLELLPILYLSHTAGLEGSSAPQRMLEVLVAVLEAAPEV